MSRILRSVTVVLCMMALIVSAACSSGNSRSAETSKSSEETFELHLDIMYETNIIFAIYDVEVQVDGSTIGVVSQGDSLETSCPLKKGDHSITFKKKGDKKSLAKQSLTVEEESYFSCSMKSHTNSLDINDPQFETATARNARIEEEREQQEKLAAEQKAEEEKRAADEKAEAERRAAEQKAAEEAAVADAKRVEDLEKMFPKDIALKVAIVALTNATAADVFAPDGNTYDPSKYHSYSDHSGDHYVLVKDGEWSYKDDATWHVEGLKLKNHLDVEAVMSADVTFDGTNYKVSNLSGILGKPGIGTPLEEYESFSQNGASYLTVTPELLN